MKQFAAFVRKEFYHIFRDKRTVLILLGMPIIQIIIFGFAIRTEVENIRLAVLDQSGDEITSRIVDRVSSNQYFDMAYMLNEPRQIDELFRSNKIDAALVFQDNFGSDLARLGKAEMQLVVDATDPNTAATISGYVSGIALEINQELNSARGAARIIPVTKLLYNPQMKSAYNFVPGVMGLILMLICAMMTSISIVREKEQGSMEVLLASPVRPLYIIISKAVPYFTLSAVNLITILLLSVFVLNVPVAGNLISLALVSLLFILVALSLGLLISSLVKSQVAAMLASSMVLLMPVMVLSGMIFPIESMPYILQLVSHIIPAKWYIMAVKKIMIEGLSIGYAWKEVLILFAMAAVILGVSFKKFKIRLE